MREWKKNESDAEERTLLGVGRKKEGDIGQKDKDCQLEWTVIDVDVVDEGCVEHEGLGRGNEYEAGPTHKIWDINKAWYFSSR